MYYNGFFGVLKERNGKFEGYIKDIPEDIYYSGATEEEAQAAFRREVDKYIAERRKRRRVTAWVISGVVVALVVHWHHLARIQESIRISSVRWCWPV